MAPWMAFIEAWAVQQLLRTPAFHRAVEKVAKGVHRVRHGVPPEELGGTKIDQPGGNSGFIGHFFDELKTQVGKAESKQLGGGGNAGVNMDSRAMGHGGVKSAVEEQAAKVDEMNADAAWREAQRNAAVPAKQGFLGEYTDALRKQLKSDKRG